MSDLEDAVVATKIGYEVDEKSMHDDDMIGYAETITSAHDEILMALAKAKMFDNWIAQAKSGHMITIDAQRTPVIEASIGVHVGKMLEPALKAKEEELQQASSLKI
jgi:hypothetical protein